MTVVLGLGDGGNGSGGGGVCVGVLLLLRVSAMRQCKPWARGSWRRWWRPQVRRRGVVAGDAGMRGSRRCRRTLIYQSVNPMYRRPTPLPGSATARAALQPSHRKWDALKTAFHLPTDNNNAYLYTLSVFVCIFYLRYTLLLLLLLCRSPVHRHAATLQFNIIYSRGLHAYMRRGKRDRI